MAQEFYSNGTTPQQSNPIRVIEVKMLQVLQSGTVGTASPDYINYAGPPASTPPTLQNIVVDSQGQQWQYWGGAWH